MRGRCLCYAASLSSLTAAVRQTLGLRANRHRANAVQSVYRKSDGANWEPIQHSAATVLANAAWYKQKLQTPDSPSRFPFKRVTDSKTRVYAALPYPLDDSQNSRSFIISAYTQQKKET